MKCLKLISLLVGCSAVAAQNLRSPDTDTDMVRSYRSSSVSVSHLFSSQPSTFTLPSIQVLLENILINIIIKEDVVIATRYINL